MCYVYHLTGWPELQLHGFQQAAGKEVDAQNGRGAHHF